jgi:hypothetical protein
MVKVEIEELEDFLNLVGWHIFEIGERKKGHFVFATKDDYQGKVKPMDVPHMMIELI